MFPRFEREILVLKQELTIKQLEEEKRRRALGVKHEAEEKSRLAFADKSKKGGRALECSADQQGMERLLE